QRDASGLAALRAKHELALLSLMTLTKRKAIEDFQAQLQGLQQSLANAQFRQNYYDQLISQGLIAAESTAVLLMAEVLPGRIGAIAFNGLSIAGYLAPNIFGLERPLKAMAPIRPGRTSAIRRTAVLSAA